MTQRALSAREAPPLGTSPIVSRRFLAMSSLQMKGRADVIGDAPPAQPIANPQSPFAAATAASPSPGKLPCKRHSSSHPVTERPVRDQEPAVWGKRVAV